MNQNNQLQDFGQLLVQFSGIKPPKTEGLVVNYSLSYTRVSSKKQEEGFSLSTQSNNCESHRKEKAYIDLGLFGNIGESGSKREREKYYEMLDFADKCPNKPLVILVDGIDRFTREGIFGAMQRRELKEKGIYVQDVSKPRKLGDEDAEDEIDNDIMEVKRENRRRAKKCNVGKIAKMKSGGWLYRVGPGYKRIIPEGEKKSIVVIDGEKIQYISKIFELVDNHLTYHEVAKQLDLIGYKTTPCCISKLIRNPFYCGWVTTPLLKRAYAEGKADAPFSKGTHPPIISEEMFLRINGYVKKNHQGYKCKIVNENLPLKKFCMCSECGDPLTGYHNPKSSGYDYYKCRNGCKIIMDGKSHGVTVNVEKMHSLFNEKLREYTINPMHFEAIKKQLVITYRQLADQDVSSVKLLKTELTNEKTKLENLEENAGQGKVSTDLFNKLSTRYNQKIAEIEDQLKQVGGNNSNLEKDIEKALETSCNLLVLWNKLDFLGKQRLQYLLFPGGIKYSRKNNTLLTAQVNPIFRQIAELSSNLRDLENQAGQKNAENCAILYYGIETSNSFDVGLAAIIEFDYYIRSGQLHAWPASLYMYTDTTGATILQQFNYVSDTTLVPQSGNTVSNGVICKLPDNTMFDQKGGALE